MITGSLPPVRGALLVLPQILGAIVASALVSGLFPGDLQVATALSSEESLVRGLFLEMFLTSLLLFTIFMLAAEKTKATYVAPVGIGLALFVAELAGTLRTWNTA